MAVKKQSAKTVEINFESTLARLETLMEEMESDQFGLEESLKAFKTGVELTRSAQNALAKAEQKVRCLIEKNGKLISNNFSKDEHDE